MNSSTGKYRAGQSQASKKSQEDDCCPHFSVMRRDSNATTSSNCVTMRRAARHGTAHRDLSQRSAVMMTGHCLSSQRLVFNLTDRDVAILEATVLGTSQLIVVSGGQEMCKFGCYANYDMKSIASLGWSLIVLFLPLLIAVPGRTISLQGRHCTATHRSTTTFYDPIIIAESLRGGENEIKVSHTR